VVPRSQERSSVRGEGTKEQVREEGEEVDGFGIEKLGREREKEEK
jgi:hypothetical protein